MTVFSGSSSLQLTSHIAPTIQPFESCVCLPMHASQTAINKILRYVITALTNVCNFSFLYRWNYVKVFVCHFTHFLISFPFAPGYYHRIPICPHIFQKVAILIYKI